MSSGCGDVLSLEDLKTAKIHHIFEAEVITGLSGGVSSGAPIDYATNLVTGQVQKTMPAILRDIGFRPATFNFTTGGTLNPGDSDVAVLWPIASGGDGNYYSWKGALPKVIPANSTPSSTGGVSSSAWSLVGDLTLRKELAATSPVSGAALIGYKGPLANETPVTLKVFTDATYLLSRWGAVGDGVADDSAAIQRAVNAIPEVATLWFDKPAYKANNITIPKGVSLLGSDFSQSGVHLINNHATNPTFKATDINNIKIDGFYFDSSVTRTSTLNGYLSFTTCHRVTVQNCFFWEYFLAVSFNGGTEINFDTCEGFTTKNGTGSGFAWFGKDNYTGSINIVNCYLKVDDGASTLPEFGIRFGHVDVAYIDGSTTIIRHGHDVEVVPRAGQFAHLIKIVGGILDTASAGIFVQPLGGADAEVELVGCYSAAMAQAAWVFDGTNGKVVASISGGQIFNCGVSAIEVIGANATVNISNTRLSNNQIGLHVTNSGTCYADSCLFGDFDNAAGNQSGYSIDSTGKGHITNPMFRNNVLDGSNLSAAFKICDTWLPFTGVNIAAGSGALGPVTLVYSKYKLRRKELFFELAFTVTNNNTAAASITTSMPLACVSHVVGSGRNVTNGKMLQVTADPVGSTANPDGKLMSIFNYDNTFPGQTGSYSVVVKCSYEIA